MKTVDVNEIKNTKSERENEIMLQQENNYLCFSRSNIAGDQNRGSGLKNFCNVLKIYLREVDIIFWE